MREFHEKKITVGFDRPPKAIFDEIEQYSASMIRAGWSIERGVADQSLGYIDIIYYRDIDVDLLTSED